MVDTSPPWWRRPRGLLDGPPPALPPALDRIAEWWASATPRTRLAVGLGIALTLIAVAGMGAARSPWGATQPVLTATTDLPAGHVLQRSDLRTVDWPSRVVPATATPAASEVTGRVLTTGLAAETPLTSAHLGSLGVADDLGAGRVGVAVPLPETVAVHPGQHLDILTGDTTGGGRRVATAAEVLTVGEATAWVAVDRDEAAAVAGAASWGKVRVAVLPTPGASPGAVAPRPSARQ